jgi:hypothetical protein
MSGSIPTPSSARLPDSPTGYQYLVEKMRIAAEWRPSDYIPVYKQGDVVFYENNMYIKKTRNNNKPISLPPNLNTNDWISLENYIKNISIGDSWISRKFYFSQKWKGGLQIKSKPDLLNFELNISGTDTNPNFFEFVLSKNGLSVNIKDYIVNLTPIVYNIPSSFGQTASYYRQTDLTNKNLVFNANIFFEFDSSNSVTYKTAIVPFDFDITVYFSKNL